MLMEYLSLVLRNLIFPIIHTNITLKKESLGMQEFFQLMREFSWL